MDISKTAIATCIFFMTAAAPAATDFRKTMRYELTGTTVTLELPYAQTGPAHDPLYSLTAVSRATMVFERNGHGSISGNHQYLVTGVFDPSLLSRISWADSTEWTAEFTYQITKNNDVSIFLNPGSWKGIMTSGAATGAKYTVEYDGNSTTSPHLLGVFSKDRKQITLRSNGLRDIKTVFENGLISYQKGRLQGIGVSR